MTTAKISFCGLMISWQELADGTPSGDWLLRASAGQVTTFWFRIAIQMAGSQLPDVTLCKILCHLALPRTSTVGSS